MANIQQVDYKAIPGKTSKMRENARALNKEITTAYQNIGNMSKDWYGVRYNSLVESFNKIIPDLNELLKLVVSEIPEALDQVASNYSKADTGSGIAVKKENSTKIQAIKKNTKTGLRFIPASVTGTKNSVSTNFKNAKNKMNAIETTYKSINWKGDAADAFQKKFTSLKNSIVKSFDELENQFKKLMDQALSDMGNADKANTVS